MKRLFFLIFLNAIFSINGQTKDLNQKITKATAKSITTFDENDISSMVTYYFASRIRRDQKWKLVLRDPEYWSARMTDSIKEHNKWKFIGFKNLGVIKGKYGIYVKVYIEFKYKGQLHKGEDEVEVGKLNGKYYISKVPT